MLKKLYLRLRLKLHDAIFRFVASDWLAIQSVSAIGAGYLPWGGATLRPTAAMKIANDIMVNRRRNVLELGSGVSTLLLGKLLSDLGGRLVSVDHDEKWIAIIQEIAQARGFAGAIEFVHAPLKESTHALNGLKWYCADTLRAALGNGKFDVLLVDGPIGGPERSLARYPALPFLKDHLAESAAVYLDDISRDGEREIIRRWTRECGVAFECDEGTLGLMNGNLAIGLISPKYTP